MNKYEPPRQSRFGQLFDSLLIMAVVLLALFVPLWLKLAGSGKVDKAFEDVKTWAGLGQNETMSKAWEGLGHTPETASAIIVPRFDYTFDPLWLAATAALIIGYFLVVLHFSKVEYRDVVEERFGDKKGQRP